MDHPQCDALNVAREAFIEKTSELEFKTRYAEWKFLADTMYPGEFNRTWDNLPFGAAETLANAIMKAIADIEDLEQVSEAISTVSKKAPVSLTEKIAKAHARAGGALKKDGMEVLT